MVNKYKVKLDGMLKLDTLPQSRFFMPVNFEDERNMLFGRAEIKQIFDENNKALKDGGFMFIDIQDLFSLKGNRFIEVYPFADVYSIITEGDVQVYLTNGIMYGAMYEFNKDTVEYFINNGVVVKEKKKLFYKALNKNDTELVKYLIDNDLVPNMEECEGDPYYFAIQNHNVKILKLLHSITKNFSISSWNNMLYVAMYTVKDYDIALYMINEVGIDIKVLAWPTQLKFRWWCFRHGHKIRK